MNLKKLALDAAVLKGVTEVLEMAGRRRRKPASKRLKDVGVKVGKTVEGIGTTAGKTMEGLSATAGKTVEGLSTTVGKTVEGLGATAGKTAGALGEAVEKTVETTIGKTKDMTVGKVDELKTNRRRAKLARRRQKIRKQRMDRIGTYFGFGLVIALLYWWETRRDKSMKEMADHAAQALRSAQGTVTRTAQQVASRSGDATEALRTAKDAVARTAQEVGSRAGEQASRLVDDVKTRIGADRGMDEEGNGHGRAGSESESSGARGTRDATSGPAMTGGSTAGGAATTGGATGETQGFEGRSEVWAPGELRGASGPAISPGMKVVGFDGVDIGRVQEVEEDAFILDRPKGSDLRVPKDAVARVEGTVAYLRVAANRVVQQGWTSMGNS
jgi:hypothetical protein